MDVNGNNIGLVTLGYYPLPGLFRLIAGIFIYEGREGFQPLIPFGNSRLSKGNHAAKIRGVFFAHDFILIDYGKRDPGE